MPSTADGPVNTASPRRPVAAASWVLIQSCQLDHGLNYPVKTAGDDAGSLCHVITCGLPVNKGQTHDHARQGRCVITAAEPTTTAAANIAEARPAADGTPSCTWRPACASDPNVIAASEVEYDWVNAYAERQYAETIDEKKGLDDKAASIITHLSSGTGIATLGSILAVGSSKVDPVIVGWMLPAILAAFVSIYYALRARSVVVFQGLPTVDRAKAHAEYYQTEKSSKQALIPVWIKILAHNEPLLASKAKWVNKSMFAFFVSIIFLLIPFTIAICTSQSVASLHEKSNAPASARP